MWNGFRVLRYVISYYPKNNSVSCFSKSLFSNSCKVIQTRQFSLSPLNKSSYATYEHSTDQKAIGKITPKLLLAFTCKICNTRLEKYISKVAYHKGIVIVRCDKCEENHLIADNLGWFPDLKSMRNIEDIMASKGETVKKSLGCYEIKEGVTE